MMFRFRTILGVDFSERYVALALVRRHGVRVVISETYRVPLTGNQGDDDRVLAGFLRKKGWTGLPVVLGLRGQNLLLRILDISPEDVRTVPELIEEQMEHFATMGSLHTVHEHRVTRIAGGGRRVLFAASRMDTVNREMERMQRCGLSVSDLLPAAVALYNLASSFIPRPEGPLVCVDVEGDYTAVVIGQDDEILFVRRFLIGSQAVGFGSGADARNGQPDDVRALEGWLSELTGCLSYFQSRNPARRGDPGRILVCGEPEWTEERLKWLRGETGLAVDRLSGMGNSEALQGQDCGVVAAALGMAGMGKARVPFSMLPRDLAEALAFSWQWRYWVLTGIMLVLSVLMYTVRLSREVYGQRRALAAKTERFTRLQAMERDYHDLQVNSVELRRQLEPIRAAALNGEVLRTLLAAVSESRAEDDWLYLIADSVTYFNPDAATETGEAGRPLEPETSEGLAVRFIDQIIIEGFTPVEDLSTVRGMISRLREYPFVKRVDLLPDDKVRPDEQRDERGTAKGCHLFALEIRVRT